MAADPIAPPMSQAPPDALAKRTATVATKVKNTIRVPTDRYQDGKATWFKPDGSFTGTPSPTAFEGNLVKFMVDGKDTFPEMVAAMRTATQPGHFIYIGMWWCDVNFNIVPGVTVAALLKQASKQGVMIRAMLWKSPSPFSQNEQAIMFLNSQEKQLGPQGVEFVRSKEPLENAAAIWDNRGDETVESWPLRDLPFIHFLPTNFGAQHQKILCVYGEQGLISFCGGIEFNANRNSSAAKDGDGGPLHDVHCRIQGPASLDVVKVFYQRWNDHPDHVTIEKKGKPPLIWPATPGTAGDHIVQVGRTFDRKSKYQFAPNGETTAGQMIANAIRKAKHFIYTEDQYFVGSPLLQDALLEALPNIEHFTAVITFWTMTDMPYVNSHRRKFINELRKAGGDKVRIFTMRHYPRTDKDRSKTFYKGMETHTYVHSKTWIVDDEFASIGSINSNRRGWSHDCEVAAGIYERSTDQFLHYRMAHWLRIKIWQEHLGMQNAMQDGELASGTASAVHWLRLPTTAIVSPYDLAETNSDGKNDLGLPIPVPVIPATLDWLTPDYLWDHVVDPA